MIEVALGINVQKRALEQMMTRTAHRADLKRMDLSVCDKRVAPALAAIRSLAR